jgi:DNA polymerase III epsilon subunit-like protein
MSFSKKQLQVVSSFIGKNILKDIKLKKVYSDEWLEENKHIISKACTADTETTGICPLEDEITELAIRPFLYNKETFEIVKVLEAFDQFQEPSSMDKMTPLIEELTGITSDMVLGQSINWEEANSLLEECDFIVAHNAEFDKTMLGQRKEYSAKTEWICSLNEINWYDKGLPNRKQEILGPALALIDESLAFDFEAHRAINDVDALLQLIINVDGLEELLMPMIELRVSGYVSKNFYELYWKRNRCWFKVEKLKDENGKWFKNEDGKWAEEKYCVTTLKQNQIEGFKKRSEEKALRIEPKAKLTWKELPAKKKY